MGLTSRLSRSARNRPGDMRIKKVPQHPDILISVGRISSGRPGLSKGWPTGRSLDGAGFLPVGLGLSAARDAGSAPRGDAVGYGLDTICRRRGHDVAAAEGNPARRVPDEGADRLDKVPCRFGDDRGRGGTGPHTWQCVCVQMSDSDIFSSSFEQWLVPGFHRLGRTLMELASIPLDDEAPSKTLPPPPPPLPPPPSKRTRAAAEAALTETLRN